MTFRRDVTRESNGLASFGSPSGDLESRPTSSIVDEEDARMLDALVYEATDDALVRRTRAGDERASREIVRRYRPAVYRLALRMTRNPHDADDVAQEAFVRAFRSLHQFEGQALFLGRFDIPTR
jgi:hypothetical protein